MLWTIHIENVIENDSGGNGKERGRGESFADGWKMTYPSVWVYGAAWSGSTTSTKKFRDKIWHNLYGPKLKYSVIRKKKVIYTL